VKTLAASATPYGAEDRHREAEVVARLGVLLERAHVADVVGGREDPQERRHQGENEAESVRPELDLDPRQDHEERQHQDLPVQHRRHEGQHGPEGEGPRDEGHRFARVDIRPQQPDRERRQTREEDRQDERGVFEDHVRSFSAVRADSVSSAARSQGSGFGGQGRAVIHF